MPGFNIGTDSGASDTFWSNLGRQLQFVNSATAWDRAYNYHVFSGDGYTPNPNFIQDNALAASLRRKDYYALSKSIEGAISGDSSSKDGSGKDVSGTVLSPDTFDYLNAELAKAYGMDRATAYQEALANSEYQRAVADMQSAGLNPAAIFGRGSGSPAASFSGSAKTVSGEGSSSGKSKNEELPALVGSVVTLLTTIGSEDGSFSKAAGNAAKTVAEYFLK